FLDSALSSQDTTGQLRWYGTLPRYSRHSSGDRFRAAMRHARRIQEAASTSQSRATPSTPPEASIAPPRLKARLVTGLPALRGGPIGARDATLHSRIVPSKLPEASIVPSGLNATLFTISVCPRKESPCSIPSATSHRRIV